MFVFTEIHLRAESYQLFTWNYPYAIGTIVTIHPKIKLTSWWPSCSSSIPHHQENMLPPRTCIPIGILFKAAAYKIATKVRLPRSKNPIFNEHSPPSEAAPAGRIIRDGARAAGGAVGA